MEEKDYEKITTNWLDITHEKAEEIANSWSYEVLKEFAIRRIASKLITVDVDDFDKEYKKLMNYSIK